MTAIHLVAEAPIQGDPVHEGSNKMSILTDIERRLSTIRTVDEAKEIRDQAEALRVYAKSAKKGLEIQNHAAFVKIQAERRAGELLAAMEPKPGRPKNGNGSTLEPLGIDKGQSHRWQAMAAVPEEKVRELAARATDEHVELTSTAVYNASKNGHAVHFSSATDMWATPKALFDVLDAEFGFTLDVCATRENAKCPQYFTETDDGLSRAWTGTCWMNPPYGDEIGAWVAKARASAESGATVVCLVPARTDTAWWWENCIKGEVRFLRGRLRFGDATTSAPFPSAVIVFAPAQAPSVVWWEWQAP